DETGWRPERVAAAGDQRLHVVEVGEIGRQCRRRTPGAVDLRCQRLGFILRAPIVDADAPVVRGEIECNGTADAARGAGDQSCLRRGWHAGDKLQVSFPVARAATE